MFEKLNLLLQTSNFSKNDKMVYQVGNTIYFICKYIAKSIKIIIFILEQYAFYKQCETRKHFLRWDNDIYFCKRDALFKMLSRIINLGE